MKLFYQDPLAKLYVGDARDLSPILRNESVDFVVTSPPYWDIKNYRNSEQIGLGQSFAEYLRQLKIALSECSRVLKSGRFLAIVIGTRISDDELVHIPASIITVAAGLDLKLRKEILWIKPKGTQGLWQRGTTQFLKQKPFVGCLNINIQHEFIHIYQKSGEFRLSKQQPLEPEFIKEVAWSVWQIPVSPQKGHPAPFPLELPLRLIKLFSLEAETILDPFVGTGSTLLAASYINRKSVGVEIHEPYCELAKQNLARMKVARRRLAKKKHPGQMAFNEVDGALLVQPR